VTFGEGLLGGLKAKIKVKFKVGAKDVHAGMQIRDAT
jgi:hypothetical protein